MFRTSPRSSALACVAVLGVALLRTSAADEAASCGARLELQAEYYAWAVPGYAFCVATGDWDEDGRPDVAVAHAGSTLTTLSGKPGFRMVARREIPLDIAPRWVVAHDMDGDAHQDLVVTGDGGTRILAGDGTGRFHETERFAESGIRATVGNLDGDGRPDIVLAGSLPPLVVILRGTGQVLEVPGGEYSAVLADFDHDGDLDLASYGTRVWLNDGHGHFGAPATYPSLHCPPTYLAAGDVNGDGNPDLFGVTTREGGGGGCDMLLLGRGDGTFQPAAVAGVAPYALDPRPNRRAGSGGSDGGPGTGDESHATPQAPRHVPPGPEFVVLADFDGDGRDDPVRIGGDRGHELNGQRSLDGAGMACAADMDLDGNLDVVVAGFGAIAIHPGNGDGTFRSNPSTWTYYPPFNARLADLDGDGRLDVAVTTDDTDELVVALTAADGGFKRIIRNQVNPGGGRIQIADFDGDGRADLLDASDGLYLGNGDGTFRTPALADVPFGVPGDFNEDGHMDVASALGNRVRIMFGNGDGTFRSGPEIPVMALELQPADVDHDGHLDLVATTGGFGTFACVIYGKGDGTAAGIVPLPTETVATPLSMGDFDADGRMDFIVPRLDGAAVYMSRGRTFVRSPYTGAPRGPIVGDLDGDGILDLMAGDVWFGLGDGTFEYQDGIYGPGGATFIDDRNGDGLGDVVAVGSYDEDGYENTVTLIPNRTLRNRAPITSEARASVVRTWPPNGDFVDVAIAGVTDPDDDPVTITCLGVTQDEPVTGGRERAARHEPARPDSACADAVIAADGHARVRLARDGSGNGRVYEITYSAADACGASSLGRVRVCVPHDPGRTCVDDGQRFTSVACDPAFTAQEVVAGSPRLAAQRLSAGRWAIRYSLGAPAEIRLEVFDLFGRRIAALESGRRGTGLHESPWTPPSREGVFFVRLTEAGGTLVRRCVVLD